ncbi:MAG: glycerol-3-phosphate 1-O-acyltransferase PlsY [Clostridia bacterium]|nr:glycerol-3-phosphate 1-O-acyltransferase PlsY [Clostridia bacterium]
MMGLIILAALIGYALGSISFSVIFSKKIAGFDLREKGSGNAGSTNALRTAGKKVAILTLICDILKGVVAILLAILIGNVFKYENTDVLVQLAAIAAIIGHTFPVFFGFKGGKGVATSLGVLLLVNWKIGLICLIFALILMAITKIVSVGSIAAAILFPVLVLFIGDSFIVEGNYFIFSIILALLVVFNHRSNIKKLANGTENKLSFKK